MRRTMTLFALLVLVLTLSPATALALAPPSPTGTWIVTLRDGIEPGAAAVSLSRAYGGRVGYVYDDALNGFSFRGSQAAATALSSNPNVILVEADAEVWVDTTQMSATWGLDRIDQQGLPLSGTYSYERTGSGVTAYVIDSGIRFSHAEFAGRAIAGIDLVGDGQNGNDCNGHGTHVAGTIGGSTYGVAKNVTLVSVRVFGCSGGSTWETIIAGIDWVIAHHASGPAVANMSLGGGASSSVDTATNNLINDGVATAVAAGNGNVIGRQADACNYSPARVPAAMTVSATDSTDTKASWANYGACVDWFAPGVSITSAWYTSNTATNTISGTSMATPHTAGVAALYLESAPTSSPGQVRDAIFANTTKDIVSSSSTANNDLLYSGFIGAGGGGGVDTTPPAAPTGLTATAGDAQVALDWSDNTEGDLAQYHVYRGTALGGPYTGLAVLAAGASQYTDSSVMNGTTYYYVVTASDASGNESAHSNEASATPAAAGGFTLSVSTYKVKGVKHADLVWSGASSSQVDIWRDGALVSTTANDGEHTDTGSKGGGSYTYKVCEAGTTTCSNEAVASY